MKRIVIITVGKTHSGKTTFAKALEQELNNSVVIDQDNHAEFINTYYKNLLPKQGTNTIKYAITQTIVDYAVEQTNYHLILCNSNRNRKGRLELLRHFNEKGFISILVNFDIPEHILRERVTESSRSTNIFRSASTFEEVLIRQQAESHKIDVTEPTEDEADYLFVIKTSDEVQFVIHEITNINQNL
ncbi:ATP-binding protein [Psychrobacillus sp. FSL H8-0483]|uniref:ATP-binding protein n=1 Tax=Psychrobacillus sp. FSL H8-0483 TaxID=2921389 RepID=UPI00315A3824